MRKSLLKGVIPKVAPHECAGGFPKPAPQSPEPDLTGPPQEEQCLCAIHSPMERVEGAVYDPGGWRVPNPHCPVDHTPREGEGETRLPIKVPPHTPGFRHPEREDPKMIGIVSHDEPSLAELLAIPAPQSPEPDLTGQPQEGEVFVPSEAQRAAASEAIEWLEAQESEGERVEGLSRRR